MTLKMSSVTDHAQDKKVFSSCPSFPIKEKFGGISCLFLLLIVVLFDCRSSCVACLFLMPFFFIIILFAQQHHSWKGKKWTAGMTKLQPLTGEQCIITGPFSFPSLHACMDQRDWLGRGSSERRLISCLLSFRNCTLEGKKTTFIIACSGMIVKGACECVISRSHLFSSSFFTG